MDSMGCGRIRKLFGLFIFGFSAAATTIASAAADDLSKKLKSPNISERREAARELGKSKDPKAVGPLIQALKDGEPMVRLDASGALVEMGEAVVDPLMAEIKHETSGPFLWNAIRVLDMLGYKRAIPVLQEVARSSADPNIQQVARYTIERLERNGK